MRDEVETQVGTGVGIGEAARLLGITPNAVKMRLKRGSLPGYKEDGVWRVVLADPGRDRPPTPDPTPLRPASRPTPSDPITTPLDDHAAVDRALLAEVDRQRSHLEEQVHALTSQVASMTATHAAQMERADTERAELRRLLGNAQLQLAAVLPSAPHQEDTPGGPPTRAEAQSSMQATNDAPDRPQRAQRRSWFHRLLFSDYDPTGRPPTPA